MKMNNEDLPENPQTTKIQHKVEKSRLCNFERTTIFKSLSILSKSIQSKKINKLNPCQNYAVTDSAQSTKIIDASKQKKSDNENNLPLRVKTPLYNIQPWAPSRVGKKLLVLDLDKTVCDLGPNPTDKVRFDERRPYLTKFLCSVYEYYDIVIWSATQKVIIMEKIHRLKLFSEFSKILFYLDIDVMLKIKVLIKNKPKDATVKPLEEVWRKAPRYGSKNTLIIDDRAMNFIVNPKNGLQIKAYYRDNFRSDNELKFLSKYLVDLAKYCNDFTIVNHKNWKSYKPKNNVPL